MGQGELQLVAYKNGKRRVEDVMKTTGASVYLIIEVFNKTTRQTPNSVVKVCQRRITDYDRARMSE